MAMAALFDQLSTGGVRVPGQVGKDAELWSQSYLLCVHICIAGAQVYATCRSKVNLVASNLRLPASTNVTLFYVYIVRTSLYMYKHVHVCVRVQR